LPKKQKEAIYSYYYVGLSTEEIAKLSNVSAMSVRQNLSRARNTLKEKIEEKEGKKLFGVGLVLVPLAMILLREEELFASTLTPANIPPYAPTPPTLLQAVANSIYTYVAVVACGLAIAAVGFLTTSNDNDPPSDHWTGTTQQPEPRQEQEQQPIYTPTPYQPIEYFAQESYMQNDNQNNDLNAPQQAGAGEQPDITDPEPISNEPVQNDPEQQDPILEEPIETVEEPVAIEEPVVAEPLPPEPDPQPQPDPEPQQPQRDRTQDIIAALQRATTRQEVERIKQYYGFSRHLQVFSGVGTEGILIHTTNEGSGAIIIGTLHADGRWFMQFHHQPGVDTVKGHSQLLDWMEAGFNGN
jgi:DNA-directed RNA polymerase specialized sigma24 family protein